MSSFNLIIILIFTTATIQGTKECAKFFCSDRINNCGSVNAIENGFNQAYIASTCKNGERCSIPGIPWQTFTYSSEDAKFNCQRETTLMKRLPGEDCITDTDCENDNEYACYNTKCIGAGLGETCQKHNDCIVGLFCDNSSGKCA
jgi:hypothetical protein